MTRLALRGGGTTSVARDAAPERMPMTTDRGPIERVPSIDALDGQIIEALQENGREAFRRIAGRLGVSEATVRARYARLTRGNVMRVTGVTNPLALGFDGMVMVGVKVGGAPEPVADELARWSETSYVVITAGHLHILPPLVFARPAGAPA